MPSSPAGSQGEAAPFDPEHQLLPGKAAWLQGLPRPPDQPACELAWLWGQVPPAGPQGPLAALRAMLQKRIEQHADCPISTQKRIEQHADCPISTDDECHRPEDQDWVCAGSVNVVTSLAAAYVVRAGYEYLSETELASRRAWAGVLAREGVGVDHLLYGWAVPCNVATFLKDLRAFNVARQQWKDTCRDIPQLEGSLFERGKGPLPKYPYWLQHGANPGGREFYLIRHILPLGEMVSTLLASQTTQKEHRRVLRSVHGALLRYVRVLKKQGLTAYGCLDLKFDNMLQIRDLGVRLIDVEPYDRWTFPLAQATEWEESLQGHSVAAWALALYLYTVANSVANLLIDMGRKRTRCLPEPAGEDPPLGFSCPFKEAVEVLRAKAKEVGEGSAEAGMARALHLLADVEWTGTPTPGGFLERMERYVHRSLRPVDEDEEKEEEQKQPIARAFRQLYDEGKQTDSHDLGNLISALAFYALACHCCWRLKPESIRELKDEVDSLQQRRKSSRAADTQGPDGPRPLKKVRAQT